jgi:hypothetical protein
LCTLRNKADSLEASEKKPWISDPDENSYHYINTNEGCYAEKNQFTVEASFTRRNFVLRQQRQYPHVYPAIPVEQEQDH